MVHKMQKKKCKCMGPTGLCTWKVCWRDLPDFQRVAEALKRNFEKSHKLNRTNSLQTLYPVPTLEKLMKVGELFHLDTSPGEDIS